MNLILLIALSFFSAFYLVSCGGGKVEVSSTKEPVMDADEKGKTDEDKKIDTKNNCKIEELYNNLVGHWEQSICEVTPGQGLYTKTTLEISQELRFLSTQSFYDDELCMNKISSSNFLGRLAFSKFESNKDCKTMTSFLDYKLEFGPTIITIYSLLVWHDEQLEIAFGSSNPQERPNDFSDSKIWIRK